MRAYLSRVLSFSFALCLAACASTSSRTKLELSSHQDPASFHRAMSYALLRTGQYGRAIPHIRRLQSAKPKAAEPHYLMGRALAGMDLLPQARGEVDRALAADPKFAPAHSLLGLLLERQGDHRAAERAHRAAVRLDGKTAAYQNNLGFCLYLQNRHGEAIAAYRRALALDPAAHRVHNNLAFAYARSGDLGQARKHFAIAGDSVEVSNNMGLVYEIMGQLEKAFDLYQQALEADATRAQARENLSRVCKKLGRPEPAAPASQPTNGSTMP